MLPARMLLTIGAQVNAKKIVTPRFMCQSACFIANLYRNLSTDYWLFEGQYQRALGKFGFSSDVNHCIQEPVKHFSAETAEA